MTSHPEALPDGITPREDRRWERRGKGSGGEEETYEKRIICSFFSFYSFNMGRLIGGQERGVGSRGGAESRRGGEARSGGEDRGRESREDREEMRMGGGGEEGRRGEET